MHTFWRRPREKKINLSKLADSPLSGCDALNMSFISVFNKQKPCFIEVLVIKNAHFNIPVLTCIWSTILAHIQVFDTCTLISTSINNIFTDSWRSYSLNVIMISIKLPQFLIKTTLTVNMPLHLSFMVNLILWWLCFLFKYR